MKILIISSFLPYPLFSGGHVRLYNLIKELSDKHEITLICEKRSSQTNQDIAEIAKICTKVITVERRKQWSINNILQSATSSHSFLVMGHTHREMQEKIKEVLSSEKFDLIHIETFYVMQNLQETNIPIVLVEHNIEYSVYEKFALKAPSILRPLLAIDIAKIKKEEELSWKRANALVAVSREDQKVMEQAGCTSTLVSNGVNIGEFTMKKKLVEKENKVLFIGDFKWIQNQDTVKFIIEDIWPPILQGFAGQADGVGLKLWIVGRKIPDAIKQLTDDSSIIFDEKSSTKPTAEIFQEASIVLTPIRVGGGTSYKILESMACGTPVVTMQMSADAIDAVDGTDIMVGKTADELAEKTVKLLRDPVLYERISKNGRALIEKNYTWKEITKKLEAVYKRTT